MNDFLLELLFIFQRLDWLGVLDISLVTLIFFGLLYLVRDTQATLLLRGVIFIAVFIALFANLVELPAFSWLLRTVLPAIIFAIPVIFAPEIRRALERIGRAGTFFRVSRQPTNAETQKTIQAIATAVGRLAAHQHGALIVIERFDPLDEYIHSGVLLHSAVTPELLIQIFYPNTPLHDGAVVISENRIVAAACVMPLSSSGILARAPERKMGLRHRAALGISEVTDAIAIVVSEETGSISIAHAGRIIRRIDAQRLENILHAFYQPEEATAGNFFQRHFPHLFRSKDE
ncbi:MAG: diadenylate cyclase CdaA [Anaerolineales bacterium]|nr:diadenylate cyclase CdaA [Anaerolineales bacterium]MCX7608270.1 diadenylate cyclase CdaA [Anaerolineales bacterium]